MGSSGIKQSLYFYEYNKGQDELQVTKITKFSLVLRKCSYHLLQDLRKGVQRNHPFYTSLWRLTAQDTRQASSVCKANGKSRALKALVWWQFESGKK